MRSQAGLVTEISVCSCMYFHFRCMQISFISKDCYKSPQSYDSRKQYKFMFTILVAFLNPSQSTALKFPIWTHHRIRPAYQAHMKRPWIKSLEDLCWNLKDSCRDLKDPCAQGSKGSLCLDLKDLCRNLKDLYKNFKVLYRILKDLHKDPKVPCRELKDLQYTNLKDPCRSPKDLSRNQKDLCRNLRDPWMKDPYRDHK